MRKVLLVLFSMIAINVLGQDEGAIVKKERIEYDNGIFVGGGVSIVPGSNLGDYTTGINFEAGYIKRMNRVFSIGGSISYLSFKYDPDVTGNIVAGTGFPSNFYYNAAQDQGILLKLSGGDVSLLTLAANFKLNFVPVKDNSTISVYAFAKPFIASATVSELTGYGEYYYFDGTDWLADPSSDIDASDGLVYESKSSITGGVFIGPGIEINPAKPISIFLQASFGYTFPLDVVSTLSYPNSINDLVGTNFPMKNLGFSSINFSAGVSFNID